MHQLEVLIKNVGDVGAASKASGRRRESVGGEWEVKRKRVMKMPKSKTPRSENSG
jgi:hypothetical protein